MKIGELFLIPTPDASISFADRYRHVLEMAEYGNDKGFEAVWITEHHFSDYGYSPNPLMLLGEVGRVAPDLRLGTAILVLPLWHPVRLAEDVATLDVLSGGRVDVGIGRGYQPYEFGALGVDLSKNRDQFNEALNIAIDAWTKDDFEYDGRFWNVPRTTVFPKPVQQPHPPIWMAATTPPSIRAAVERGYHLCTGTGAVFEELQMRNAYIDSVLADMGRPPEGIERAANRFVFCSTSQDEIDDAIHQSRWQIRVSRVLTGGGVPIGGRNEAPPYPGEPDIETWQRRMIIGDPDECVRRIQNLADAGITYIFGLFEFGGLDHDVAMRSIKLFSDHVMPAIRDIKPVRAEGEERDAIKDAFLRAGPGYQGV
jgi:alkanesulfonate monooxygenase SsuD/methylene tetrahydromethanopterin reductase-like flavin-dependent oxidoreductase (luciferase family)